MRIETTTDQAEVSLVAPAGPKGPGWVLGRLVLAGLLLTYLAGWVQDFQRVRRLEAEPTPPSKIITKHEAWQRIHLPFAR
jgi:hypothetical protein